MRTPEETARLANGLKFDSHHEDGEPGYIVLCHVGCSGRLIVEGPCCADDEDDWMHPFAHLAADLAEARAEVAAMRQHVELLAEWQAAKQAEEQLLRLQTTAEFGELATARRAWEAAAVAREAIEERMLAANLSGEEV